MPVGRAPAGAAWPGCVGVNAGAVSTVRRAGRAAIAAVAAIATARTERGPGQPCIAALPAD